MLAAERCFVPDDVDVFGRPQYMHRMLTWVHTMPVMCALCSQLGQPTIHEVLGVEMAVVLMVFAGWAASSARLVGPGAWLLSPDVLRERVADGGFDLRGHLGRVTLPWLALSELALLYVTRMLHRHIAQRDTSSHALDVSLSALRDTLTDRRPGPAGAGASGRAAADGVVVRSARGEHPAGQEVYWRLAYFIFVSWHIFPGVWVVSALG